MGAGHPNSPFLQAGGLLDCWFLSREAAHLVMARGRTEKAVHVPRTTLHATLKTRGRRGKQGVCEVLVQPGQ